jgi:hypothetical protein
MSGSGRPDSKQVKILQPGTADYHTQQHGTPPAGSTTQHPNAVQKLVASEQAQQLQDKGGA